MTALVVLEGLVIGLLCVLVVGLLRSHAEILRALHDLGVNLDEDHDDAGTFRVRATRNARSSADRIPAAQVLADLRDAPTPTPEAEPTSTPPPGIVEARRDVDDPARLGDARDLVGETADGEAVAVGVVDAAQPTLLAFLSTGCATCEDFWNAFADGVSLELDGRQVRVVAVTKGPESESPGVVARLQGDEFTTVMSSSAYDDYDVPVSPYFVLVDAYSPDILGEGAASSWAQLASLLNRAVADRSGSLGANRTRREVLGAAARSAGAAATGPLEP